MLFRSIVGNPENDSSKLQGRETGKRGKDLRREYQAEKLVVNKAEKQVTCPVPSGTLQMSKQTRAAWQRNPKRSRFDCLNLPPLPDSIRLRHNPVTVHEQWTWCHGEAMQHIVGMG